MQKRPPGRHQWAHGEQDLLTCLLSNHPTLVASFQIDEPALREGLPLRQADRGEYLQWAVDAFRLASSGAKDETQIHTHMCYCEFKTSSTPLRPSMQTLSRLKLR